MTRTFISIEISDEVRSRLGDFQGRLESTGADLKLVEPQNIHLTLRFLGDVPEKQIEEVKNVTRDAGKITDPFDLEVNGVGVFPHLDYIRVIWAGVGEGRERTTIIRQRLDKNLAEINFPPENKEFTPHITFARVRSGKAKNKIANLVREMSDENFGICHVDAIELRKSKLTQKGPIYSTLERARIG